MTHPDIPLPPDPPKKRIRRPLQESGGLDFDMAFELPMGAYAEPISDVEFNFMSDPLKEMIAGMTPEQRKEFDRLRYGDPPPDPEEPNGSKE